MLHRKCWYCQGEFEPKDDKDWFCSEGCAEAEMDNDRLVTDDMES